MFPGTTERGTNGPSFLTLEGKIEQRIRILRARKRPCGSGLSKQLCPALTLSLESCDKHLKTPQNDEMGQTGQQNPGQVDTFVFILFPKGNILFHRAILSIVILNSMKWLVQSPYRIYSNKCRDAYLIFRTTSAALIRGWRLFEGCAYLKIVPDKCTFSIFLFNGTSNRKTKEKFGLVVPAKFTALTSEPRIARILERENTVTLN